MYVSIPMYMPARSHDVCVIGVTMCVLLTGTSPFLNFHMEDLLQEEDPCPKYRELMVSEWFSLRILIAALHRCVVK